MNQTKQKVQLNYTCQIITLKTVNNSKVVCQLAAQLLNVSCTLRLISKLHFFLLSIRMTTNGSRGLRWMIIIILHQHNMTEQFQDNETLLKSLRAFLIAYQTSHNLTDINKCTTSFNADNSETIRETVSKIERLHNLIENIIPKDV